VKGFAIATNFNLFRDIDGKQCRSRGKSGFWGRTTTGEVKRKNEDVEMGAGERKRGDT